MRCSIDLIATKCIDKLGWHKQVSFPRSSLSENVQIPVSTHRGRHNHLSDINNLAVKHGGMTAVDSTFSDKLEGGNDRRAVR